MISSTDTLVTSDVTPHRAEQVDPTIPHGGGLWGVSWLPERMLTKDEAITAVLAAEAVSQDRHRSAPGTRLIETWAGELGLSTEELIEQASVEP